MSGTDTDTNMYKYVSAPRFLYLRKDPFILDSNIITELQRNERVQVLDTKEGWSQVVYNDSTGYVKDSYIRSPLLTDAIREGQVPDTLARR